MFRRIVLGLFVTLIAFSCLLSRPAAAQAATIQDGIVGAWTLVSVVSEQKDGSRGEPFGPNPKGIIIFSRDGHFSLFQSQAELPRLAANDRARATPEEALTVVRDSIAYYGTYAVDEAGKSLSVRLDGSTYANLLGGLEQRRIINSLTATELKFSNPKTPNGMTLHTVWRRPRPQ
jgi:hypothetical protein